MRRDEKTLNDTLLHEVARRLGALTVVDTVRVFPREKPSSVVAQFVDVYYLDTVGTVELKCRAYQNGDFNVTYRENRSGTDWIARGIITSTLTKLVITIIGRQLPVELTRSMQRIRTTPSM